MRLEPTVKSISEFLSLLQKNIIRNEKILRRGFFF